MICPKVMLMLYPLSEAVRSGGDLRNAGGSGMYARDIVCPDGCVMFRLTAKRLSGKKMRLCPMAFSSIHCPQQGRTGGSGRLLRYQAFSFTLSAYCLGVTPI